MYETIVYTTNNRLLLYRLYPYNTDDPIFRAREYFEKIICLLLVKK